ncbi:MAG: amidohydrolase, partial [Fulvivirga sp.]|nr:amidohydrolase [Fulvivirga sp.]
MYKTVLFTLVCFIFLIVSTQAQEEGELRMDWEEYDPPSTLVVPETIVRKAKYPFIDVHNHQFSMPSQDLSKTVEEMNKLNMAVMVNLSGRGRGS